MIDEAVADTLEDGKFVVSVSGRGFRRLHRVGACHFRPGVDYAHYVDLGYLRPESRDYDDYCRRCFGAELPLSPASTLSTGSSSEEA